MKIPVRLSAGLVQATGTTRLVVTLTEAATLANLLDHRQASNPVLGSRLETAVPTVSGRHASSTDLQRVAFLCP